jgi:hypothetical protein
MPDYWDTREILSREECIECRFSQIAVGLGHLDPLRSLSGRKDLPAGSVLRLPLWMATHLRRLNSVELMLPKQYGLSMQSVLLKGSEGGRFGEKSRNFFTIGLIIAWLIPGSTELAASIFHGVLNRMKYLIDQSAHISRGDSSHDEFFHRLTEGEEKIYLAGALSNEQYDRWRHGGSTEMTANPEIMSLLSSSGNN